MRECLSIYLYHSKAISNGIICQHNWVQDLMDYNYDPNSFLAWNRLARSTRLSRNRWLSSIRILINSMSSLCVIRREFVGRLVLYAEIAHLQGVWLWLGNIVDYLSISPSGFDHVGIHPWQCCLWDFEVLSLRFSWSKGR